MAALRGVIRGDRTRSNSDARSTRLADHQLAVHADTWHTFCETDLNADGSGSFRVRQHGRTIISASWSAETVEIPNVDVSWIDSDALELARKATAER